MTQITQEELKRQLHYDPLTGIFTRLISNHHSVKIGDIAGTYSRGYIRMRVNKIRYLAHVMAWLYTYNEFPENQIDHKDGTRSNNKIDNLQKATNQENMKNRSKYSNNMVGYTGVSYINDTNKFMARITDNGVAVFLGVYDTALEASDVREKYAKDNFGEFYRR